MLTKAVLIKLSYKPSGQNYQKNNLKEFVFVTSALKIQGHVVKNTLIQTAFSVFLATGRYWKKSRLIFTALYFRKQNSEIWRPLGFRLDCKNVCEMRSNYIHLSCLFHYHNLL